MNGKSKDEVITDALNAVLITLKAIHTGVATNEEAMTFLRKTLEIVYTNGQTSGIIHLNKVIEDVASQGAKK